VRIQEKSASALHGAHLPWEFRATLAKLDARWSLLETAFTAAGPAGARH
jgi:hypothetical protein